MQCSVRRADELTTHDRAHGAEAMDGRAERDEADTHSHSHRRHARLAAAKDYGARRPDDDGALRGCLTANRLGLVVNSKRAGRFVRPR